MKLSLQLLWRPLHIHTPLVSAYAVIMWCMKFILTSYRMRLLDRSPVCMGDLLLYFTCISPFSFFFLFYSWVKLFFLDSMAVYAFCCCVRMCLCGVVWCGVALLSLFLS